MTTIESDAPPPRIGPAIITYLAAFLGALFVWATWHPHGLALVLTVAAPVAALGWLAWQARRRRRASQCTNPAQRAYVRRAVPLMLAYGFALAISIRVHHMLAPSGPLAVALAILPAVPLIGVIWAMGRLLIEEQDEYLRSLHIRQFMIATGFMLVATCIWGFLESFELVPNVPMYWAFILWCVGLGIGTLVNELRA